jgi:hypothetical protein
MISRKMLASSVRLEFSILTIFKQSFPSLPGSVATKFWSERTKHTELSPPPNAVLATTGDANVGCGIERAREILVNEIAILFYPNPLETFVDLIVDVFVHGTHPIPSLFFSVTKAFSLQEMSVTSTVMEASLAALTCA